MGGVDRGVEGVEQQVRTRCGWWLICHLRRRAFTPVACMRGGAGAGEVWVVGDVFPYGGDEFTPNAPYLYISEKGPPRP